MDSFSWWIDDNVFILTWNSIQLLDESILPSNYHFSLVWTLWSWIDVDRIMILPCWIAYTYCIQCNVMMNYVILDQCGLFLEDLISTSYILLIYGIHCNIYSTMHDCGIHLCRDSCIYWLTCMLLINCRYDSLIIKTNNCL